MTDREKIESVEMALQYLHKRAMEESNSLFIEDGTYEAGLLDAIDVIKSALEPLPED